MNAPSNVVPLNPAAPPRALPHNLEAEQALLGAVLINNDAFDRVADFLRPEHFSEDIHQRIFEVAGQLIRSGKPADPVTLPTFLGDHALGEDVTTSQYLARLCSEAVSIVTAYDYGRAIYDLALRRAIIAISQEATALAYDSPIEASPQEQIEELESRLYEITENGSVNGGFQRFRDAAADAVDMAARAYERDGRLSGLATGLRDLDQRMGGLQASDLIILAGRPGMGKSALAANIGVNIALKGAPVGFFSLEMSAEQLATRIIADRANIASHKIRRGDIGDAEFTKISLASRSLADLPFYIDQTGGLGLAQIAARARRLKRQKGLALIIIDYLQLLSGVRRSQDNRVAELTAITMGLKALAKKLEVPILALSQLSRQVESRDDKRPQLSDLRESGSIEQDSDVVLFIYREEYYLKNKEPKAGSDEHVPWMAKMEACVGKAEIIVSKQRHGPTGTVPIGFNGEMTRFADLPGFEGLPERMF